MHTRLQLSSCITLSISPLCFPFQTFLNREICKSQGKRGSKATSLKKYQPPQGTRNILVSNPMGGKWGFVLVELFCASQTQQDMTLHGDKKCLSPGSTSYVLISNSIAAVTSCIVYIRGEQKLNFNVAFSPNTFSVFVKGLFLLPCNWLIKSF